MPFKFAYVMKEKLERNRHKGTWRVWPIDCIFSRILDEVLELAVAIKTGESPEEVEFEAADVADFAMMVADIYKRLTPEERGALMDKDVKVVSLQNCVRCGGDHNVVFRKFQGEPIDKDGKSCQYWGICQNSHNPIFLSEDEVHGCSAFPQ